MIALENIVVQYGAARVLSDVTVKAAQDEIIAIIGRNGAGKSTTLKAMMALLPLQHGRRLFNQQDISHKPVEHISRLGIALVPDSRRIFPNLTVMENLRMGALAHKPGYWTIKRVLDIFPRLQERIAFGGDQLSGGEQQMLSIGRAMMAEPILLILDEPSLGLSPLLVEAMLALIRELNKEGLTIFLVEQNVMQSLEIADRAYVIENGRVVLSGAAGELIDDSALKKSYLGL